MNSSSGPKHTYTAPQLLRLLKTQKSDFWIAKGQEHTLDLFHRASVQVPAYKDFLKKHKINSTKIKTWEDFQYVPRIDKKNYLQKYKRELLCWNGNLSKPLVFTATSGSTGEPYYFPRSQTLDWQYSVIVEEYFQNSKRDPKDPVLVIIGFGMGLWIGGLITYKAFEIAGQRAKIPLSLLTPGINKTEIFNALTKLAPSFKEVVLIGYPPFIKDVLDEATEHGINLKKLNIRLFFAAESFTETFREYVAKKAGIKNLFWDTLNIYGSADIGAMAYETGISTFFKRIAINNKQLFKDLFTPIAKTPTLAQFNPLFTNFESVDGEILLSGDSELPLIRYAIGDTGGVKSFNEVASQVHTYVPDYEKQYIKQTGSRAFSKLPFVYIYERGDFATKLYGATIFPEHVRDIMQDPAVERFVTGKFTMITKFDRQQNQYLEINVELRPHVNTSKILITTLKKLIVQNFLEKNAEYKNNYLSMGKRVEPKLIFWPTEHPLFFKPGVKQKWVRK